MKTMALAMLLVVLPAAPSLADSFMDNEREQQVLRAQELLLNDRFEAADSVYRVYIALHPDDPTGYLFRAGALFAEMADREEKIHADIFRSTLDTVDILTSRIADTADARTTAWMYLFRGHARAYRSLYESKFGSFLTALKLGLKTIDEYENGLQRDSTLIDLYAGIGSYHYWKSAKAGFLKWIGVFKDERDKGIRELRRAADSSLLHRDLARSALVWIWLDQKEYDSATAIASALYERFPEGKTFLWPMAYACYRSNNYPKAAELFSRIRALLEKVPGNYFNLIECDYHLVQCYSWMGEDDRAVEAAQRSASYRDKIPNETLKRQHGRMNYLTRIAQRR